MDALITILWACAQSGFVWIGVGGFALALITDRL